MWGYCFSGIFGMLEGRYLRYVGALLFFTAAMPLLAAKSAA